MARTRHALVATIAAAALTIAACGTGTNGTKGGSSSQTLTVQTLANTLPAIQAVAKKFQAAHPGVKITYSTLTDETSRGPNITVLGGNGTPDVGFVELSTGVYSTLVKNKALTDLDSVYQTDGLYQKISKDKIDYMTNGTGHPYGLLLYDAWGSVIFYNEKQFADAGVTVPTNHQFASMDDFYRVVNRLKAKGHQALGLACGSASGLGHTVDGLLPTSATKDEYQSYISDWRPGSTATTKYTDPAFTNVLRTLNDWRDKKVTEPGCLAQNDDSILALFQSGKVSMKEGNSYEIPSLFGSTKPSFPVGWFMAPPINPGAKTPFWDYTGDMLVVPTHAQHKTLAQEFVQFFGQSVNLVAAAQANSQLPIISQPSAADIAGYSDVLKEWIDLEKTNGTALIWDSAVPATIGQKTVVPQLQKLWAGSLSADDLAATLQRSLQDLQSGKVAVPGL